MPNGWEYPGEAPTKEEIERGKAFMAATRGEGGPEPKKKERKYEPLPGFGWEWPWPVDWEKFFKFPMEALAGQRPWETWGMPYQGAPPLPETALPADLYRPPEPWEYAGWTPPAGRGMGGVMSPEILAWMEQVKAWERGEIPALAAPPERLVLPREWAEWYGGVTTPELHPKGNVQYYAREYTAVPKVTMPENYHRMTDEEQMQWLDYNAYETVYTDERGNIIDVSEVMRRAVVNPDEAITQVWFMGGGETQAVEFSAGDIQTVEELKATPGALGRRGEVAEGVWKTGEALFKAREREGLKLTLESSLVQSLLGSGWSYEDKFSTISDLYSQYTGRVMSQKVSSEIRNAVFASLPPEEQEAIRGREEYPAEEKVTPGEKAVDVGALSKALAPYGVNLTTNYPFISPITQAHLMRIPSEVLKEMARYLEGKGISWQDFLSVSAGWYGGGAPARGRWEIPRQWG